MANRMPDVAVSAVGMGACRVVAALTAVLNGILVGCGPMPSDALPDNVEVRLLNPVAWPSGKLLLVTSAFVGRSDLPDVRLDTLRLAVSRVDDSTFSATLPDTSGVFPLRMQYRERQRVGSVTLVGFVERTETVALMGWPVPLAPGSPIVIAAGESTLVRLDLRTGATVDLGVRHSGECAISPGPSYRDSAVVAQGPAGTGCETPKLWAYGPNVSLIDSLPLHGGPADRVWAELAADTWLQTAHHFLWIHKDGQITLQEQIEEGERVVLSPDHSRAVVLTTDARYQDPVLLTAPGTIAFRIPLFSVEGVAFTPDGDTIFAAGYSVFVLGAPQRLVAVRATTGAVLAAVDDTAPQLWDLVLDPDAPLLYGVGLSRAGTTIGMWHPVIVVFDRHTLQRVGLMRPPTTAICASPDCSQVGLALDPSARRLYAFDIEGWRYFSNIPTAIFSYDLVPATQSPQVLTP